jgi:predicted nucleic acid-binding protein
MPTFYLDTSALAKRYRDEPGTEFIDACFALLEKPENKAATSFLTFLELLAMASRLRKGQQITQESHDRTVAQILQDMNTYFALSGFNFRILARTVQAIRVHAAPDAQQLATALELEPVLKQLDERLIFIADDEDLHEAAQREGLEVLYPREKNAIRRLRQRAKSR